MQRDTLTLTLICVAHVASMAPFSVYPALIPELQAHWQATGTQIGWIAGIYFGGYLLAVALVVPLTDQIDARRIYLASMSLTIAAPIAFALLTPGIFEASIWRFIQGAGLGGTYMPGLKALVDAAPAHRQSRTVAIYTSCFGVGVAVSFLIVGHLQNLFSWQGVFALSAIGGAAAFIIAAVFLPRGNTAPKDGKFKFLTDFRPVFRNRLALRFSITYAIHNAELFAFRFWTVAFMVFVIARQESTALGSSWNPAFILACATLAAQPFSILVNEMALRFNRAKVILTVMTLAAASGIALGFSSALPIVAVVILVCLYAIFSIADSASITAAVVEYAEAQVRGTTMALHTLIGFGGAFLGPIAFGAALDLAGGAEAPLAWAMAFASIAALIVVGFWAVGQGGKSPSPK